MSFKRGKPDLAAGRMSPVRRLLEDRFVLGVFAAALLARLLYLSQISGSPLFNDPPVDGGTYADLARRLASGDWLLSGSGPFWQPPLYSYFLGLVRWVAPESFFGLARVIQAGLGAITCVLVYGIGRAVFSPYVARLASVCAVLYGPFLFFDGEMLPATLAAVLNAGGLLTLLWGRQLRSWRVLFGAGVLFGLAALAVATTLPFVGLAAVWMFWRSRQSDESLQQALRPAAIFIGGCLLVLAPIALRNATVGDDRVLISYNWGVNYYLGNNPDPGSTLEARPGWEWDDIVALPIRAGARQASERAWWFAGRSLEFLTTDPLAFLRLQAAKALQFVAGEEVGRNQDLYFWRHQSPILRVLLWKTDWFAFPFGLVAPLAVLGWGITVRRQGLGLPAVYVVVYAAGVVAFFVTARYRIPVLPVILLFAASGVEWLRQLRRGPSRTRLQAWGVLAVVTILVNSTVRPAAAGHAAVYYYLGNASAAQRHPQLARDQFARSVELDPEYWQSWNNLGTQEAVLGNMDKAARIFERVLAARPQHGEVWLNLAHARVALRDAEGAAVAYESALEREGPSRRIYTEMMVLFSRQGEWQQAEGVLERALLDFPEEADDLRAMYERMVQRAQGG